MPRQQKIPEDFTCEFCGVQKKVLGHRKFQEHYQEHLGDKFDCLIDINDVISKLCPLKPMPCHGAIRTAGVRLC